MKISFVVPCYQSTGTIAIVIEDIERVIKKRRNFEYEIILVNDCSPDDTWNYINSLCKTKKCIKVVDLAKNFGQASALMAGFSVSEGEYVMTVEDDGQSSVEYLWEMMALLDEEHDIVCARNVTNPKRSLWRKAGAKLNRWMLNFMLEKPKSVSPSIFFVAKRSVIETMLQYKNPYPYMGGLILRSTVKIANYDIHRKDRISGKSNYNLKKLISLWVNGVTAFSIKPLRIASIVGIVTAFVGGILALVRIVQYFAFHNIVAGYTSVICILLLLGGCMLLVMGIIGEYVGRIYMCINNQPQYIVRQINQSEEME